MEQLIISTEYITLSAALKFSGAAVTGGEAKELIADGAVSVGGEVCLLRGKKLRDGDIFTVYNKTYGIKKLED